MNKPVKSRPTPEYRLEVVKLVTEQNYSIREAAEAMSVGKSTVDKWVRDYRKSQSSGVNSGAPVSAEQVRIRELERENRRFKEEIDILKKASALLMSDSLKSFR